MYVTSKLFCQSQTEYEIKCQHECKTLVNSATDKKINSIIIYTKNILTKETDLCFFLHIQCTLVN